MTDLTFCYLHMTKRDLQVLDLYETKDYVKTKLSDDEIDIPFHMIPPNPEDSDNLPSNTHPSYPYGNPMSIKHPASRPRPRYDPIARTSLHTELGYDGGGLNGSLRWKELALSELLPVDELKEEAQKAMEARQMASGAGNNNNPQAGQAQEGLGQGDRTIDEEEEEEEEEGSEEDENDENELDEDDEEEDEDESEDE
ncbi:hypothetical protein D9758_001052 [Tetrapyrgos nigripes]|uniref:Uncharacterized protein n=1 Tax=Tetrapyrgos nigripes TaxID=182062 RepID=A0A8H5LUK7_9AGAR|nr:hypothetical protein D9758_001052 [Tetrapyrgos nigripes]